MTEPTTEAGRMLLAAFDNPTARTAILAIEAEARAEPPALDVERLRQRDSQSEPDQYWTGWNDALDAVARLAREGPDPDPVELGDYSQPAREGSE